MDAISSVGSFSGTLTASRKPSDRTENASEKTTSDSHSLDEVSVEFPLAAHQFLLSAPVGFEPDSPQDNEASHLLRSFDMIFQLHQRSEEIRSHLAKIDHILLTSRSVAALTDRVVGVLEQEFDLVSARILLREDHPVASSLKWASSSGSGILPPEFLANESLIVADPFVLDDPSGDLAHALFGDSASLVSSAAVANLCPDVRALLRNDTPALAA